MYCAVFLPALRMTVGETNLMCGKYNVKVLNGIHKYNVKVFNGKHKYSVKAGVNNIFS